MGSTGGALAAPAPRFAPSVLRAGGGGAAWGGARFLRGGGGAAAALGCGSWNRHHGALAAARAGGRGTLVVVANDKPIPKALKKSAGGTRELLNTNKLKPKKSLGQNFVINDDILAAVVKAANIQEGDAVLEVGPGTGNLTRHLLRAGAKVRAVEKDDALSEILLMEFGGVEGFELVHEDILRWDIVEGMKDWVEKYGRCKVVTNLPYNITSDCLKQMLPMGDTFSHLHYMLQEEAARRLVEAPINSPEYRAISVRAAYYSDPRFDFTVARKHYYPAPHVDSAMVTMELKPVAELPPVSDVDSFLWMVSRAFSSRRKMMRNNLRPQHESEAVSEALEAIGCAVDARAQELSPKEFVLLHNRLYGLTPPAEGAAPSPKHNRKYDLEEDGAGAGAEGRSEV